LGRIKLALSREETFIVVVILREVIHSLSKDKGRGMIFKIDFEKAYNRVR
jgi:hypothetical protein